MGTNNSPPIGNNSPTGTWTYSTLPTSGFPAGTALYTSDHGFCIWNGFYWSSQSASGKTRTVVDRLRAAIAQALYTNAFAAQPLIQPSAWVLSTAYQAGMSVSNGGFNYLCIVAGTSAGSGGPSGQTTLPIVDGTAQWVYWGPTYTSNSAQATSFTPVAFGSRYTGTFWRTTLCTYNPVGGVALVSDLTNFTLTGCPSFTDSTTGVQATSGSSGVNQSVSFWTDSPQFQVVFNGGAATLCVIYVNGVPLTLGTGSTPYNGGGQNFLQCVFPSRQPRLITVESQAGNFFYGVLFNDAVSKVWPANFANSVRLAVVGTSYIAGSGSIATPALRIGSLLGKALGCFDVLSEGVAGSGYVSPGTGVPYIQRLSALVTYNPDVVIVTGGGINDRGQTGITTAIEQAAVTTYLTALRAALPLAPIFVFGSETGATGPAANVFAMELAVSQAVAALADPMTIYIPQANTIAAKAWISGTGTVAAQNASGNSDNLIIADGIHPMQAGVIHLVQQHVNGINQAVANLQI